MVTQQLYPNLWKFWPWHHLSPQSCPLFVAWQLRPSAQAMNGLAWNSSVDHGSLRQTQTQPLGQDANPWWMAAIKVTHTSSYSKYIMYISCKYHVYECMWHKMTLHDIFVYIIYTMYRSCIWMYLIVDDIKWHFFLTLYDIMVIIYISFTYHVYTMSMNGYDIKWHKMTLYDIKWHCMTLNVQMGTRWEYSSYTSHCISRDWPPNAMFGSSAHIKEKQLRFRCMPLKRW